MKPYIRVNGYRFPGEFGQMGGFLYRLEQWEEAGDTHRNRDESAADLSDIVLNHMYGEVGSWGLWVLRLLSVTSVTPRVICWTSIGLFSSVT